MTISAWDFSYPALRAVARHPSAGFGLIECFTDGPPSFEMYVSHWVDDFVRGVRRTRSLRLPTRAIASDFEDLTEFCTEFLLSPASDEAYVNTPLASRTAHKNDYLEHLSVLR